MDNLIKEAQEGLKGAFDKLYELYYKDVYYTVYNIVKDTETANDLTSDIFIKIYQNLSMYREDISFRMWVKTIANNYCIDYLRKKKRTNEVSVDEYTMDIENSTDETPLSKIVDKENLRIMYDSIKKLKEPYKSIIYMRLEGKKYQYIAKELDINLGTLKAYINFSKRKLQKYSEKLE